MSFHIKYHGELFISDKNTMIQAIKEYNEFRKKTTDEEIKFFEMKIKEVK